MSFSRIPLAVAAVVVSCSAHAACAQQSVTLRSRGDEAMQKTMHAWEEAYQKLHPEIRFDDTLIGSATGMAGVITGASEMSVLGRPVTANEVIGFEWVHRVKPLGIMVTRGSVQGEGHSPALAVLVSRTNPVKAISMEQLASIVGCPNDTATAVTWALAGAEGKWAHRPVHVYLYDNQSGTGALLMQKLQGSKDCYNWSIVHEYQDAAIGGLNASEQIADAVEKDPDGLAITTLAYRGSQLKALPVADRDAPVTLTPATIRDGSYPLARATYIYVLQPKDGAIEAKVAEFLRFVLSPEGQAIVARTGDFVELNASNAAHEREKLK